jgi:Uma2 family endonuclease
MAAPGLVKRAATYADLLQVENHLVAEIVDGELYTSARPAMRHATVSSVLGGKIGGPFHWDSGGPGGWWIVDEPELHLGGDILVPDLAGWRRTRLPEIPDVAAMTLAPDWACEVLSPGTERLDRGKKLFIYAREGVSHLWLVNPTSQTLEVLARVENRWTLLVVHVGDVVVRAEPFEAIELDLAALWRAGAPSADPS